MPCYSPKKLFPIGRHPSGAVRYKYCSYEADYVYRAGDVWYAGRGESLPNTVRDYVVVGCGQCIGCRLEASRKMADRGLLELQSHKASSFVTLTYDNEHIKQVVSLDNNDGTSNYAYTLVPKDFTLFMKRLRKYLSPHKIRLMACGEYGETTLRPHYHAILFGYDPDDLEYYKTTSLGDRLYTSPSLTRIWGKGHVVIGAVTWESIAYVSRYILGKQTGIGVEYYELANIVPPFSRYSNKPGIGGLSYAPPDDIMSTDIHISTEKGGKTISYPRYYLDKLSVDDSDMADAIKLRRQEIAKARVAAIEAVIDVPYIDYLSQQERGLQARTKGLIRPL